VRTKGIQSVACAKLHHENHTRCIFCGKPAGEIKSELIPTISRSPASEISVQP